MWHDLFVELKKNVFLELNFHVEKQLEQKDSRDIHDIEIKLENFKSIFVWLWLVQWIILTTNKKFDFFKINFWYLIETKIRPNWRWDIVK